MNDINVGPLEDNTHSPTKMRTKKKSTLTKLKEKKLREQGSLASLQSYPEQDEKKSDPHMAIQLSQTLNDTHSKDLPSTLSSDGDRIFSTKDPPGKLDDAGKPRPRPRSGRQSSIDSQAARSKCEGSGFAVAQEPKDLKMTGPYGDSVNPTISNSGFIPRPPVTPRTPNSNPRTPRGYVASGKGEKRSRDQRSSGEEPDTEDKGEKSSEQKMETAAVCGLGLLSTSLQQQGESSHTKTQPLSGHIKSTERLLKRRSSKDSTGECKANSNDSLSHVSNGLGKPPIFNTHRNANNNSNHISGSDLPYPSPSGNNSAVYQSPRHTYLKSAKKSHSEPKPLVQERQQGEAGVENSLLSNLHISSPSHLPEGSGAKSSPFHVPSTCDTSADADGSNKSTQVMYSSESPFQVRSITSPPSSARLVPISPRPNPPPPLSENFSSQSLRTSFKIDPNVRPATGSGHRVGALTADKSDSGGATSNGDRVSQQSFASGSVLPVITTKEARSRSYLEGSIGNGSPSVLGAEELDRYFPARKVHVLVGTWNMNEQKEISYSLDDFVLPESCDYVQDIYAFGTQENDMNKKEWEIKIQETLGPSHVMYHSVSLGSLHLVVFIRRDLIWFCSAPEDDVLSLRAVTMVKTKGAIGISLSLFGTSYLFINCHLTSDRDNDNTRKKNRLGDYFKVIQDMKLPKSSQLLSSSKKTSDITAIFDCVFWCGDLNFRIERKRHAVEGKVNQITEEEFPNFETLLGGDQLLKYMTEGKIFHGFQEGRINFHPTFKFDINKDTYDSSQKNRVPSYTDRIMFRSKRKNDITCLCYDAVMSIKHSDHKPVYGQFETVVRAGTDNMVYSAGHFDRSVYMEGKIQLFLPIADVPPNLLLRRNPTAKSARFNDNSSRGGLGEIIPPDTFIITPPHASLLSHLANRCHRHFTHYNNNV
ncbi:72 kda inositol polyphosphate 5-phosphatase [Plakobranchus ocellatus]|uniref:72 kDa inositol polyphosphate 5-phosphatase n=1 Tax=Plakobranchus ocellatus TaxID=259542 RepID=A0AAV4DMU5_9GAST|nr:72 kda inositol polyphosphate 5-phosphatase [Plakobranchus ocellatus]